MGENGAGKSTLIKVLTGVYSKDAGEIYIKGNDKSVNIKSPQEAQKTWDKHSVSGNHIVPEPDGC